MKHHEQIIAYRLRTKSIPKAVFIDDFTHRENKHATEFNNPAGMPYVQIAGDFIGGLDLRFIFGLVVHCTCEEEDRARQLFKRAIAFKPALLAVTHLPKGGREFGRYWVGMYTKEKGVICE